MNIAIPRIMKDVMTLSIFSKTGMQFYLDIPVEEIYRWMDVAGELAEEMKSKQNEG